jgi:hypothetical protein
MHHIRTMAVADARAVADLCHELGYPVGVGEVEERLAAIADDADHAALVAESDNGRVVGWVHIRCSKLLVSPVGAEIGGLVVASVCRGQGIDGC